MIPIIVCLSTTDIAAQGHIEHKHNISFHRQIFLPSDPKYTWMLAKMYYNNADCAYHQSCTHLGN